MSAHIPVPKICEKLKKIDVQICELKYGMMKSMDWANEWAQQFRGIHNIHKFKVLVWTYKAL